MEKIETLSSIQGRKLLAELYKDLRFERQMSALATLLTTLRICVRERELHRYMKRQITVLHPLGLFSGIALWMEEIVNRYYFSAINSFVYFGAAILLVLIGVRRFSSHVTDEIVIGGIVFEALMLLFMFVVMLFAPGEDVSKNLDDESDDEKDDLLMEVGEISRDFAAVVVQLEDMKDSIEELIKQQVNMINAVSEVARNTAQAIAPNPQMIDTMRVTNAELEEFKNTVESFNRTAKDMQENKIAEEVSAQLSKIIASNITKDKTE